MPSKVIKLLDWKTSLNVENKQHSRKEFVDIEVVFTYRNHWLVEIKPLVSFFGWVRAIVSMAAEVNHGCGVPTATNRP